MKLSEYLSADRVCRVWSANDLFGRPWRRRHWENVVAVTDILGNPGNLAVPD
jgi:hypothetical protein